VQVLEAEPRGYPEQMDDAPVLDPIEASLDRFEAHFLEALDRCLRRQFWTFVGAMIVSFGIVLGVLAAFGRDAVGLTAPVFALLAVVTYVFGVRRSRLPSRRR
jgi:hypothetical protein